MSRVALAVRDFVRQRASERCAYCLKPEMVSTYGFHVDHVIPILHGGRVTVRVLTLNHADQLIIRANLIDAGYWPPS